MKLDFKPLTHWQQQVFAAALLQRMLPNYALFTQATGFGDYALVENQLDLIWQKLARGNIKINQEVQLDKLDLVTPDPQAFDVFAAYPAQDVCCGMVCLLQSLTEKETQCASELSGLSYNSVEAFLQMSYIESNGVAAEPSVLSADPLIEWEQATQTELLRILQSAEENKMTCQAIKAMVTDERLSNLGISY